MLLPWAEPEELDVLKAMFRQILETVLFASGEKKSQVIVPSGTASHVGGLERLRTFLPTSAELHELDGNEVVATQVERLVDSDSPYSLFIAVERSGLFELPGAEDDTPFETLWPMSEDQRDHKRLNQWIHGLRKVQKAALESAARTLPAGSLLATVIPAATLSFSTPEEQAYLSKLGTLQFVLTFPFESTLLWRSRAFYFPVSLIIWAIRKRKADACALL